MQDAMAIKKIESSNQPRRERRLNTLSKKNLMCFGLQSFKEFIHFGLTSQDINNTAIPLSLKEATQTAIHTYFRVT